MLQDRVGGGEGESETVRIRATYWVYVCQLDHPWQMCVSERS